MITDLLMDYGEAVTTPYYQLQAADGSLGSHVTSGFIHVAGGQYFLSQVDVGTARVVYFNCVEGLEGYEQLYLVNGTFNSGTGTGPKAITIHITDGTNPLNGVAVAVLDNTNSVQGSGTTPGDNSGNLTVNLLATTAYSILTYKNGYNSSPSAQTTGSGNGPQTLTTIVMTPVAMPSPPSDPSMCRISGYLRNQRSGAMMAGVQLLATRLPNAAAYAGGILVGKTRVAVSDATGIVRLDVQRNDLMSPNTTTWHITCPDADIDFTQAFTTSTFLLSSLFP